MVRVKPVRQYLKRNARSPVPGRRASNQVDNLMDRVFHCRVHRSAHRLTIGGLDPRQHNFLRRGHPKGAAKLERFPQTEGMRRNAWR